MKKIFLASLLVGIGMLVTQGCKKDSDKNIENNHRRQTGASANDLLSSDKYKSLVVQIQYMTGFKPTNDAIARLTTFLNERLNKSDGIEIVYSEIGAQGKGTYSIADVVKIEDDFRSEFTHKKEIAAYFLFVDGDFVENTENSKVLGAAYYNTSMVIFQKTILDLSGGLGEPSTNKLEATVINHEFGHILGLVNLGTAMQTSHQDSAHGAHCSNSNCLMNWQAETGGAVNALLGNSQVPSLDQNCINDLQNNGGK